MSNSYRVLTAEGGKYKPGLILGSVSLNREGWRFIPNYQASPSRRAWPTPEAALYRVRTPYILEAVK